VTITTLSLHFSYDKIRTLKFARGSNAVKNMHTVRSVLDISSGDNELKYLTEGNFKW
jgi:hypothetical protein